MLKANLFGDDDDCDYFEWAESRGSLAKPEDYEDYNTTTTTMLASKVSLQGRGRLRFEIW